MYPQSDNSKLRTLLTGLTKKREAWKASREGEWKKFTPANKANRLRGGGVIRDTSEVQRILELPRKKEAPEDLVWLAKELTDILKTDRGQMSLRPLQAEALRDLSEGKYEGKCRGIFSPARVGAGKTLISLLAPTVLDAQRVLLLVPAKLLQKTLRDRLNMSRHWIILDRIRIESYEKISRVSGEHILKELQPDLIIADEAHKLKNRNAAVTRRVMRYMEEQPNTVFVALSGTITKRSLNDYAHILKWTHKGDRPVPTTYGEVEAWAMALDVLDRNKVRNSPGALLRFCSKEELELAAQSDESALTAVRRGYQRRLAETHGVVITPSSDIDASLSIQALKIPDNEDIQASFHTLRKEWMRPDGVDFSDPVEVFRTAKQLSLGFYYRWNPPPPKDWMDIRREWNRLVRRVLDRHQEGLDSPLMVFNAIREGRLSGKIRVPETVPIGPTSAVEKELLEELHRTASIFIDCKKEDDNYDEEAVKYKVVPYISVLEAWKGIEPTFTPKTEVVWVSDHALELVHNWTKTHNGIIWVEHVEFGKKLESKYGIPYYGRQGMSADKRFIDDHPKGKSLVASIGSNSEGRNLQDWNDNLITSVMPNALQWEQLIGRTHRDGQQADEVSFDVLVGCAEHIKHFNQSIEDAKYQLNTLGQPQKLLIADITMPEIEELTKSSEGYDYRFYTQENKKEKR